MGLIVVDTSVWIDLLLNKSSIHTSALEQFRASDRTLVIADLVLSEVLQGIRHDRQFRAAQAFFSVLTPLSIVDHDVAVQSVQFYRHLRSLGITVRKTTDCLIATRCILDGLPLLYSDRDFEPFVTHLGLVSALTLDPGVN